jgi:hypothetical protein
MLTNVILQIVPQPVNFSSIPLVLASVNPVELSSSLGYIILCEPHQQIVKGQMRNHDHSKERLSLTVERYLNKRTGALQ